MRNRTKILCCCAALAIGLTSGHSARAEDRPCIRIKEACENAGFKQGAADQGIGLQVDCIRPIMDGAPQKQSGGLAIPTVDPAIVEACKKRNPEFGKARLMGPSGPPTSGSDF
jgi:hypothetical protein